TQVEAKKDFQTALGIYKKLSSDATWGEQATLGELRCLTALRNLPGLKNRADAILKEAQGKKDFSLRLVIAAYNGEGDVEESAGRTKEALFNYLRGLSVLPEGELYPEHQVAIAR